MSRIRYFLTKREKLFEQVNTFSRISLLEYIYLFNPVGS